MFFGIFVLNVDPPIEDPAIVFHNDTSISISLNFTNFWNLSERNGKERVVKGVRGILLRNYDIERQNSITHTEKDLRLFLNT